jgi:exodeoxyribonuclease-5
MTTLSAEQTAGIEEIRKWYQDAMDGMRGCFRLFGPAGTGKTTMAKSIPEALGVNAKFMTFTGKAAHVLQRKGVRGAKTIHSSIYYPVTDEETKAELQAAKTELSLMEATRDRGTAVEDGWASALELAGAIDETQERVTELASRSRRMSWEWNPMAMAEEDPGVIILDEVSMVNNRLAEDIERYGIPVLVLGDPAQLPPVEGGGHYINASPDFMLEEIHRQALESPVLELATRIRLSQGAGLGIGQGDTSPASLTEAMDASQVIVWSNKRRWAMITAMRNRWERPAGKPVAGDKIMCL